MSAPSLDILYEDNHCLVVHKPSGISTTHYAEREETLDRMVKRYLKEKYHKPGNVFLGIVHRLDRLVSGVILFARNSKAAARIAQQFREGTVDKVYWAVVEGEVAETAGSLENWLKKDRLAGRVEVVEPPPNPHPTTQPNPPHGGEGRVMGADEGKGGGARRALLQFQRRGVHQGLSWLEVRPQTGRTHQLRVQLSHHGHPIYGDMKYGSTRTFDGTIALHARSLTFLHPIRYEPITLTAPLPRAWRSRFAHLLREEIQ